MEILFWRKFSFVSFASFFVSLLELSSSSFRNWICHLFHWGVFHVITQRLNRIESKEYVNCEQFILQFSKEKEILEVCRRSHWMTWQNNCIPSVRGSLEWNQMRKWNINQNNISITDLTVYGVLWGEWDGCSVDDATARRRKVFFVSKGLVSRFVSVKRIVVY